MARKKTMAQELAENEQLDLIETKPENADEIVKTAKAYREVVAKRVKLTDKEVELKQKMLKLLEDGHVQRLKKGKRKLTLRVEPGKSFIITTEPKEETVRVREVND